jgi:hypothetical protein
VARPGQGRSGGYRVLIAYRPKTRALFLFGFAKSTRANVEADATASQTAHTPLQAPWLSINESFVDKASCAKNDMGAPWSI